MNSALMFSKASDEWETPGLLYLALDGEFDFDCDAAATCKNQTEIGYFGPDHINAEQRDALAVADWSKYGTTFWLNPPYSRCREFIAKAASEALTHGCTIVCLVPRRTDTRCWHAHVWDRTHHRPLPSVEIRFLKGRLKFGMPGQTVANSAPFPSVLIIFRPPAAV